MVFHLDYFRSLECTCHWKDHNVALKWFRDSGEENGLDQVGFSNWGPAAQVPQILHPKGMQYHFDTDGQWKNWQWQEMVAQMDDQSMRMVVQGPDNRSRGLTSCRLQQTEKYDHKRHHALGPDCKMLKVWDFILMRDDGSCVSLHPNFSSTRFAAKFSEPDVDHEIPRAGRGRSEGPGTYKYYTNKQVDATLRFDAGKSAPRQPPQSR